ncbi:hypothetical protein KBZ12_18190 [Cyanobium sp. Cruz CV13-4-11]|jgi:hypothetical protein|uniref:hypothetical protein n=1 Tax=unclassified Cyanobium TaxID=2627006 RepID=UPI0020CE5716|nr:MULTISPECIES: hypothetical protein [unclassified Cyanobium]MCP9900659.1 hypothetical protein [Cyanobium sp. Cruz CV11-17]MCP9921368.1 hypothetical protein [Cyanobium sp. Cruz CV13-4-11]
MDDKSDRQLVLQGQALALLNRQRKEAGALQSLDAYEFRVFSQFGEDGILQHLIEEAGIQAHERIFVEFGVQDYQESNTRFLLQGCNWGGLIIDGSKEWMTSVRNSSLCWRYNLQALAAWIDRDNINELISSAGISGEIGILSVDIDGNDYWVWEAIICINPIIVVCEWNSSFGPDHSVSIPYDPLFNRLTAHHSHQYWGASVQALQQLGLKKNYELIGSNQAGNNLFFVRNDRLGRLLGSSAADAWTEAKFSDTRNEQGQLTFLRGKHRSRLIDKLPLVNTSNCQNTSLEQLKQH